MTFRPRVTIPTSPWDDDGIPEDPMPMPINPPRLAEKPVRRVNPRPVGKLTPVSARTPTEIIATRCFTGSMNASDLKFMALALLQMQDEMFELRERVRALESDKAPE